MENSYLLLSGLPNWNGCELTLAEGVAIRRLREDERPLVDPAEGDGFWLCHEFENPYADELARHKKRLETGFKLMLYATYAVQVLAPCGSTGIFRLYRRDGGGWKECAMERRQPMLPTDWGVRCCVPESAVCDGPAMLARVLDVFYKPNLRLQIPLWMMEQGLAAPDQHIRILLCATGLDSLTKASGQAVFKERLCSLLGGDTLIFPADGEARQPRYRVEEVAAHLYQLRNEMAHGLPFGSVFHRKTGFLNCADEPVAPEFARHRYDKVLEECAVFLFCRALREVLLSRLVFDVPRGEWVRSATEV